MNIFGIGLPEMVLIMTLALLVFGPKKLPEIGRSLGKAIRGFQDASKEFESEFKREAESIQKTVREPMEAKLETPAQRALSPEAEPAEMVSESETPAVIHQSEQTSG
ncbi:MAG: TatA/E family twin arginine-targeting protein translocase [Cyanothece sp. SIO1E1]|nr:TatA/E family twin arginine-targeting protein translocase [Cyanothece sp. SIO1E1]